MRRVRITAVLLLSFFVCLGLLYANKPVSAKEAAKEVKLSTGKVVIKPGKKFRINVENAGTDAKVTYSSRNKDIATVSKLGKITGISEGKTTVTVIVTQTDKKGNEKRTKLKCKVKVEAEKTVSLMAVGDALIHEKILNYGKQADGTYNFDGLFKYVKKYISKFDVKIINQETIFVNDSKRFGGYPCFGTPSALGDSMMKAGFNVITCATNHAYDNGARGIKDTVEYWRQYEDTTLMTGIYDNQEDYDTIPIKEYNGIKIAFLNYTMLINSGAKREPYYIRYYKESQAEKEIMYAKKHADFVVVLPHWGTEYVHEPNAEQKRIAKKMAEAGADLIIGCHPHVVQPMKVIKTTDGRRVPCFYSLGNFVSNMYWVKTQVEGMAEVEIVKWNGKTTVKSVEFTPLINHIYGSGNKFTAILFSDYTSDLCKLHYLNDRFGSGAVTCGRLKDIFNSIGNDKW